MSADAIRTEIRKHEATAAVWAERARKARSRGQKGSAQAFFAQAGKADELAHRASRRLVAAVRDERLVAA